MNRIVSVLLIALAGALFAQESAKVVFSGEKAVSWRKGVSAGENGVLTADLPLPVRYGFPAFAVDTTKTYQLCGEFRMVEGTATVRFGLNCIASNGKSIFPVNYMKAPNLPMLKVVKAAQVGDTAVTVAGLGDFQCKRKNHLKIAFNAKEDESDIPNFDLSPYIAVDGVKNNGDGTATVTFAKPLELAVKANTMARVNMMGAVFVYDDKKETLGSEWLSFSKPIPGCLLRPGTVKAQMIFDLTGKTGKVEFRNLKVIEK